MDTGARVLAATLGVSPLAMAQVTPDAAPVRATAAAPTASAMTVMSTGRGAYVPGVPGGVVAWPSASQESAGVLAPFVVPRSEEVRDYRPWTIGLDVVATGFLVIAASTDEVSSSGTAGALGMLTYWLGTPIVHGTKGSVGRGLASFGLRAGGTIVGAYVGAQHCGGSSGDAEGRQNACLGTILKGVLVGGVVAMISDHVLLSTRQVAEKPQTARWTPIVEPTRGGMQLGLAGLW